MVASNDDKPRPLMKQFESLRSAAKRIGKRRAWVQQLVDDRLLKAYRLGGTEAKPILGVIPAEVDQAWKAAIQHVVPGKPKRRVPRPARPKQLDPAVRF